MIVHVPPVLMYHQVDEKPQSTPIARVLTVTPSQFSSELDYLAAHHRRAVGVRDYLDALAAHRPTNDMVIVTFDDGYADQYTRAFRILRQHHDRATFFITTGNVGKINHLTWRDIGIMARAGMSFGGHSVEHIDLSQLTKAEQSQQIAGSLAALRAHLGTRPVVYAYPAGAFNRMTETLLAQQHVELGFTTDPQFEIGDLRRYEIPRIRVEGGMPLDAFGAALATPPARRYALRALPLQPPQRLQARQLTQPQP